MGCVTMAFRNSHSYQWGPEVYSTLTATGTAVWSPISVRHQNRPWMCPLWSVLVPIHGRTHDVDLVTRIL
jgi:hypothetical protein